MVIAVRPLTPADLAAFREVRLEGLRDHPGAFGAAYEAELALSPEEIASRFERGPIFGAFDQDDLVGVTGLYVQSGAKVAHKGAIWGVYVRPRARGSGAAGALMQAALEHARGRVELVQLGVAVDNLAARRLYERFGFIAYGVELRAYKLPNGSYVDDMLMWRMV